MISFNPFWGGLDYIEDTPPYDSFVISYTPSIANDTLGAVPQAQSEASAHSFMQDQFRATAENMYDSGLVVSAWL